MNARFLIALFLLLAAPAQAATILYIQDLHEAMPVRQKAGEHGGWGRLKTVIDAERARDPQSVLVFGGDAGGGTLFGYFRGKPTIEAMNVLGVDVANLGNHDFDFSLVETRDRIKESAFPWINSNLFERDEKPFVMPQIYTKMLGDIKVGFIGLMGDVSSAPASRSLNVKESAAAIREGLAQLGKVDAVALVAQMNMPEVTALMEKFPQLTVALKEENGYEGLSSSTVLADGRVIISPRGNAGAVERVELIRRDGKITVQHTPVLVNEAVNPEAKMQALAEQYQTHLDDTLAQKLTRALPRDREQTRKLVAVAFQEGTNAQIGLMNAGGVRADLPNGWMAVNRDANTPTDLLLRDAYGVLPFHNRVYTVTLTGRQLLDFLATASGDAVAAGLKYKSTPIEGLSDAQKKDGSTPKRRIEDALVDEKPLSQTEEYRVSLTSFYLGSSAVTASLVLEGDGDLDAELLARYLRNLK